MAHPYLMALARFPHAIEQRRRSDDLDERPAEFAVVFALDLPPSCSAIACSP